MIESPVSNIGAFDHLKKWREVVGVKNKEKGGEKNRLHLIKLKNAPDSNHSLKE